MSVCKEYASLEECFNEFIYLPFEEQEKQVGYYLNEFKKLARKEGEGSLNDLIIEKIASAEDCETLLKILQGLETIARCKKASLYKVLELVKKRTEELKPPDTDVNYIILETLYFPNLYENGC